MSVAGRGPERPEEPFFRPSDDRRSPRRVKTSTALRFYHEVLGLDHLHYGLFSAGDADDLQGLRRAQNRYLEEVVGLLPEQDLAGERRLLDVGTGTGATSERLQALGWQVDGLAPDPHQKGLYDARVHRPFHLGRFQEFEPSSPYDVVLMSESCQYVWIEYLFDAVRHVIDDGWWVVADYFARVDRSHQGVRNNGHPLDRFYREVEQAGFEIEVDDDVTDRVVRTLEVGQEIRRRYLDSSLQIAHDSARESRPRLYGLLRRLLAGQVRRQLAKLDRNLDAAAFVETSSYRFLRIRVPPR